MSRQSEKQRGKSTGLLILLALILVAGLQTRVVYGVELDAVIEADADKTAVAQASQRRIDSTAEPSDKLQL